MSKLVKDTSFAIIPDWLVDADVSDRAIRLYVTLWRFADKNGRAFPSRRLLAEKLACAPSTVDLAIKELVGIGALRVQAHFREDGSRAASNYHLVTIPPTDQPVDPYRPAGGGLPTSGETPTDQPVGVYRPAGETPTDQPVGVYRPVGEHEPYPGNHTQGTIPREPYSVAAPSAAKVNRTLQPKTKRSWSDEADAITRDWREHRDPPSAQSHMVVAKIVDRFLRCGWSPILVRRAMDECPTITISSLEFTLRRQAGQISGGRPRDPYAVGADGLTDVQRSIIELCSREPKEKFFSSDPQKGIIDLYEGKSSV